MTNMLVLMVEDNSGDILLVREHLNAVNRGIRLRSVVDGFDALAYLRKEPPYAGAPRPDLILLDLNIPGMSGHEVLEELKKDEDLRRIPVVVLSSSRAPDDVAKSYDHGANGYVQKPGDIEGYERVSRAIHDFWLSTAQLSPY